MEVGGGNAGREAPRRRCPPNLNAVLRSAAAGGLDVSMLRKAMQLIGTDCLVETEASGNVTLETVR